MWMLHPIINKLIFQMWVKTENLGVLTEFSNRQNRNLTRCVILSEDFNCKTK